MSPQPHEDPTPDPLVQVRRWKQQNLQINLWLQSFETIPQAFIYGFTGCIKHLWQIK